MSSTGTDHAVLKDASGIGRIGTFGIVGCFAFVVRHDFELDLLECRGSRGLKGFGIGIGTAHANHCNSIARDGDIGIPIQFHRWDFGKATEFENVKIIDGFIPGDGVPIGVSFFGDDAKGLVVVGFLGQIVALELGVIDPNFDGLFGGWIAVTSGQNNVGRNEDTSTPMIKGGKVRIAAFWGILSADNQRAVILLWIIRQWGFKIHNMG